MATEQQSQPLVHLATQIFDCPLAILPDKLDVILQVIGPRLAFDEAALNELRSSGAFPGSTDPTLRAGLYGPDRNARRSRNDDEERPYLLTDSGIGIISISGTLMKKASWFGALSGVMSYSSISAALDYAKDDNECNAILLDINSPGGSTHGMFDLIDQIYGMRGSKPIFAIANDLATSAAYGIGSAADKLYVTRTGGVGSIGVFAVHVNVSEADKKAGVHYTYIAFGDKKTEGNEHSALSKSARQDIQEEVDRQGQIFVQTVARNRGCKYEDVLATQAGVLFADKSLPLLADKVGTFDDCLADLTSQVFGSSDTIRSNGRMRAQTQVPAETAATTTEVPVSAAAPVPTPVSVVPVATVDEQCDKEDEIDTDLDPDEDDTDTDTDTDEEKKKMAEQNSNPIPAAAPAPAPPAATANMVDAAAVDEIFDLCAMSGLDNPDVKDYVAKFNSKTMTMADIRKDLLEKRAKKSSETQVGALFGTASGDSLNSVMQKVNSLVANSGGAISKSQAMEQVLKSNPDMYMQYDNERAIASLSPLGIRNYVNQAKSEFAGLGLSTEIG